MTKLKVSTVIPASPERVWEDVRHLGSHVEWMDDAANIRFMTSQREGTGTSFETDTRVGPFRLTDMMVVTEWKPGRAIGIRHVGLVTGTGRFTLRPARGNRTRFTWSEKLRFPLWMGGPAGGLLARPVLKWVWRRNLTHLRRRFEGAG